MRLLFSPKNGVYSLLCKEEWPSIVGELTRTQQVDVFRDGSRGSICEDIGHEGKCARGWIEEKEETHRKKKEPG